MVGFVAQRGGASDASVLAIIDTVKGEPDGLAELDGSGRLPASQLPVSAMEYQGTWNANTNSPTLADGVGSAGDVYIVGTAGSQNLGSGSITFAVSDYVLYSGSVWQKVDTTDIVVSVAGKTGAVTLVSGDVTDFTEAGQDAVGAALANSSRITLTYNDGTPSFVADLVLGSVSYAYQPDAAALSVPGRASNSTGVKADIVASSDGQVLRRSGNALAFGTVETAGVTDDAITDAKLRNSAALSVIGRSANTSGDPADIVAGSNDTFLRRVSDALGFGQLTNEMVPTNTVGVNKLVNASQRAIIAAASAGAWAERAVSADVLAVLDAANYAAIRAAIATPYYEAGTFTPTFTFSTVGDLSVSYAAQTGVYERSGNLVYVSINIQFTPTYTTASGDARFSGLPFSKRTGTPVDLGVIQHASALSWPGARSQIITRVQAGASYANIVGQETGLGFVVAGAADMFPSAGARNITLSIQYAV